MNASRPRLAAVIFRWSARILSLVVLALFVFMAMGDNILANPPSLEELPLFLCFPVGMTAGLFLAWRWELLGALVAILCLALFYLLDFLVSGTMPQGPFFLLFTSPALLFILAWFLGRKPAA
ncbi:MAG: hypothetical protein D6E12_07425 [Desulfovibrio sp.]|nr:MAG: hypothetical protein D6E12_07425 [Desulfovibrio sp.]